jgi:hypothetical protein
MKKFVLVLAISLLSVGSSLAQKFELKAGKIVSLSTKKGAGKQPDKVFAKVDGVTFYQGSRGGIYYLRANGKKAYVKKS